MRPIASLFRYGWSELDWLRYMSNSWPDLKGAVSGAMSSRTGSDEEKLSKLKAEAKTNGFDKGHRDVSLEYVAGHCGGLALFGSPLKRTCLWHASAHHGAILPPLLPTGTLPSGQSP